jgi:peptidoglycan/xylan/chitin deacetylase (PgdA/CDA1 family)
VRAVLTFHGVDESGSVLSFRPAGLRSLVQGIRASGHEVVSLRELLERPESPDRVALTFDDGFASVFEQALPVLREEGATATLFLTTGHVGKDNGWPSQPDWAPRFPMMDWEQVAGLLDAGWEVQSHTVQHPDLRELPDDQIREELAGAREALEQRLGLPQEKLDQFAYPYGATDDRVTDLVRLHSRVQVTTRMAPLDGLGPDAWAASGVPRLDTFYLQAPWLHAVFGSASFRGWVAARAAIRRWRAA